MTPAVAIVGMACRFPDADSPDELWNNVLAQRRAFRRLPPERLREDDYVSDDPAEPDHTYINQAAVLEGWEFDRTRFRIASTTFRTTDLAHWLALEVAADALADAGVPNAAGLDATRAGVLVGNTLTGEFSRAAALRLRWPYVRRTVAAELAREGRAADEIARFVADLEVAYKAPFAEIDADTLAGSLSNTIAGRICNSFDLKGGGYTVDGACAASLLAVATACTGLATGDLDVALAGGVDLSLDPFELVGFAKAGALATDDMRVYDVRSSGFWPGEGCGFVVLRRLEDATRDGSRVHAIIRGWGVSSDGRGGITRPELDGQLLALRRAYARAGFEIDRVALFEGHGTGTAVGDRIELTALSKARHEAHASEAAAIGSIKANIGHTKAAAGVAGLLKATLAVREQVVPPTTGCGDPREELTRPRATLRIVREPEPWPVGGPPRAGVSAMGFGGINAHLVVEGPRRARRLRRLPDETRRLGSSAQDAELFVFAATDAAALDADLARIETVADGLSRSELTDLAAELVRRLDQGALARAALVAARPNDLRQGVARLRTRLAGEERVVLPGEALASVATPPRVGFLFPGQASPAYLDGGALMRRFDFVGELYHRADLSLGDDEIDTSVAQPAIVAASIAGLIVLRHLGIEADIAVGHSLGELTALHWAGALDERTVLELAAARGRLMSSLASAGGAMAGVAAPAEVVVPLLEGLKEVGVAGWNGPRQTVVSGTVDAVESVLRRATAAGLTAARLPVSHAFHSPLVAPAAEALRRHLHQTVLRPPSRPIASTITGRQLDPREDLKALLVQQVTSPVRFSEALDMCKERCDVLVEVGPGNVLARLVDDAQALVTDAGGPSLRALLGTAGALFVLGAPVRLDALFEGRYTRPFSLEMARSFLASPCELAPADLPTHPIAHRSAPTTPELVRHGDAITVLRTLIARRVELPESAVADEAALLGDLHLNSIQVAEIAAAAARALGVVPPIVAAELAGATVAELADALGGLEPDHGDTPEHDPAGVGPWARAFAVRQIDDPPPSSRDRVPCHWHVHVAADHPLGNAAREAFGISHGAGVEAVAFFLPPDPDERHAAELLEAARTVEQTGAARFAVVQHSGGGAAFAKSLHLERPDVHVCVVDVPVSAEALALARLESETTRGFREVVYTNGTRRIPTLSVLEPARGRLSLGPDDVILVTGGGKGIGAECALALGQAVGVPVGLLGRSRPEDDAVLAENLRRFERAGFEHAYAAADVTDADAMRRAVPRVEEELGPVTVLLHAAGANAPALVSELSEELLMQTLAPKVSGLRNVLAALDERRLRVAIGFSSIIARTGLRGEAHYALANEWLGLELDRLQARAAGCRCVALEWSVWSGTGMGERLGVLETLVRSGVDPLSIEDGVHLLEEVLSAAKPPARAVLAGRFGRPPTIAVERRALPLRRFLDRVRVHVGRVELVVETELSRDRDPYLADHALDGTIVVPAVVAMEAAAQAATGLLGGAAVREMRDLELARPITVPPDGSRVVRIAALSRTGDEVEVVIRSDETGFNVDHVHVVCVVGEPKAAPVAEQAPSDAEPTPAAPLYDAVLFHTGRFRRLRSYLRLDAHACVAEVESHDGETWFGAYQPDALVVGDPGARDAYIHAVQACIPHDRLLPVGVERIELWRPPSGTLRVSARERPPQGPRLVFDLDVVDEDARLCERWTGLSLISVGSSVVPTSWPRAFITPYLERRVEELLGGVQVRVSLVDGALRRLRSDTALRRAAGRSERPVRRPDGRPEFARLGVSAAHLNGTTLAVAGRSPIACDIEPILARDESLWRDLLGTDRLGLARLLAAESAEPLDESAARVWVAAECLRKAGCVARPLTAQALSPDGWAVLASGDLAIATYVADLENVDDRVAFGFLAGGGTR